ncbi:dehydrodolichyl diphosphate synthase-like protein [Sarcoptes scabiei]|uniref:Alkyl transferase n=1 Tax=Sarcoptes scabiei TaxID=52283 RepID=A0A131ZYX5_SARSC|nr:dehydrodolichyl diphosphate synthase-like protein [Sarcoptes scabiei]
MSTWFPETNRSWLERIVIKILSHGPMPKHVAFIMDGNRRYATKLNEEKSLGHSKGFDKLAEVLSWCRDFNITEATLFTFSIENFKRPKEEIDYLMNLFRRQAQKVLEEFSQIENHQICFRIYGKIDLLPDDVQKSLAKLVLETDRFDKFYLNICFAYTSREEITTAINDLRDCVQNQIIESSDINYNTLSNAMYSLGRDDPDILIRTSGEIRLSDFLLWQTSFTSIFFCDALWPEISIWNLFSAILRYQYCYESLKRSRQEYFKILEANDLEFCKKIFDEKQSRQKRLNGDAEYRRELESFETFLEERNLRIEKCRQYIKRKRFEALLKINANSSENGEL